MFNQELVQRINVSPKDREHPAALIDSDLLLELDDSGAEETAADGNVQPCPDAGDEYDIDVLKSLGMVQLRDFSHLVSRQLESSAFASIICNNGSQIVVKKSAVVWFCENSVRRLSNDRTLRVMQSANFSERRKLKITSVSTRKVIQIGDWCLFRNLEGNGFFWGRVLSFAYFNSTKKSISMFEWIVDQKDHEVGVLCIWYKLEINQSLFSGKLIEVHVHHGFHPCVSYICSCPSPTFTCDAQGSKQLFFTNATVNQLSNFLKDMTLSRD